MHAVNLAEKLAAFDDHWSPKVVAAFNGHDVMVVKVRGEFVWHAHPDTDDLFLVLKGGLRCCQTNANSSQIRQVRTALGAAECPPLGQSGGAAGLVVVSAGLAALRVEVVVD